MPPRSDARQRLLETADRLFYAEGVRAVGIDRIIAESGVAKMTLYHHFRSKDDLILAVLERRDSEIFAYFQAATEHGTPRERLANFFLALKDWFESDGFRGCAFANAAAELADPGHPAFAYVRGQKQRFHAMVRRLAEDAVGPGVTASPCGVALLVEGAITVAVISGSSAPADMARHAAFALLG